MATYTAAPADRAPGRITVPDNPRRDNYWVAPIATIVTFLVFVIYSTFRAFEGKYFATYFTHLEGNLPAWVGTSPLSQPGALQPHYWSPFYSPYLPQFLPFLNGLKYPIFGSVISASLYVLVFPLAFRGSCYYCRKAYYRAIFQDPGACAVKEKLARKNYGGETHVPAKLFNLHRYALYAILVVVAFHFYHLYDSFFYTQNGQSHFGVGFGTLLFAVDTAALSLYTFSCHSFRHLIGGFVNKFSAAPGRFSAWTKISAINEWHGQFFWFSLITVGLADLYVRLVSSGAISDLRFF